MTAAVRYCSRTGNTEKLAFAIAQALGVEAKTVAEPIEGHVDLLFLGSAVYAAGVDESVKSFIAQLPPESVGAVVSFSTAAILSSTYKQISKLLSARSITLKAEEFHCRGRFHALHRSRPDQNDIEAAKNFALSVAKA